ncbi:MAG: nucleotidyltransferase family protein [Brevundimonas sp.]|nr:MAG: nucleotidyltransferase family protein [Brevundimonas sp.]
MSLAAATELEARLDAIVRADPDLMTVLRTVRNLGLPDWLIFSGAIYQSVWNAVTGRAPGYGVRDFDVGYFDPDTAWDAEDAVIRRVAAAFEPPLRERVEVRNQARVALWFPAKFGEPYPPIAETAEALERFVAPAFAVGVRLEADKRLTVVAPFGLEDVFAMTLRPNPHRPRAKDWDRVVERALARWPELVVVA